MVKHGKGLIPSQETKIPYALQYSQKAIIIKNTKVTKESYGILEENTTVRFLWGGR